MAQSSRSEPKLQRIHRPIAEQIVSALYQCFADGYYADKVIERLFKNNRLLGSRDRKFIAETVYGCVRWWRQLWFCLGEEPSDNPAAYWRIFGTWLIREGMPLPPWAELSGLDEERIRRCAHGTFNSPAIAQSFPDWLYKIGNDQIGPAWAAQVLPALNRQAPAVLRANRLKTTRDDLAQLLRQEGIETRIAPNAPDGLILKEKKNVFATRAFRAGFFELQDGSSQQIAPLLGAQPGERVIDACAGAGGKTLHLAALMKNKGKIIAMDVSEKKLEELRRRCTRAGVDIVETKLIEGSKTIKRLADSADRVLLDVPCTGVGVIRRNPDTKWKLKPEDMERLRGIQSEILASYPEMVKKGGRLVYATCSILPSENTLAVQEFLRERGEHWRLAEERQFFPGQDDYDGFYAAAIDRV